MAIDTQNKRRSVHGYTHTPIYPVADGTVGAQDRPHVAWLYAGLSIAGVHNTYLDHLAYVLFRDTSTEVKYRDKVSDVLFRDKREII